MFSICFDNITDNNALILNNKKSNRNELNLYFLLIFFLKKNVTLYASFFREK